jgi:hypothetical protein
LVEFNSVVDAVRCAIAIQREMAVQSADMPEERRIRLRVAINMGDVVSDGDLIYGDGVAIAARMESLAEPGGIKVSRAVRDQVRDRLPIAFEDIGEHEVKDIARAVRVFRIVLEEKPAAPVRASRHGASSTIDRRRSSSSRFKIWAAMPRLSSFSTAWSRTSSPNWRVLAGPRSSLATLFTYKGKAVDAKQIARELGVRYLVEGSLRKAGNRVRISCQLVEADSGQHIWADRFDGTLEDSFDLQDRITESVIGSVGPVLRGAEVERARRKPEASRDVYDLVQCALMPAFAETPDDNEEALRLLTQALEMDSG